MLLKTNSPDVCLPNDLPPLKRFINRELSWLAFNERVLEEAGVDIHPLLERVRFLSISAENLDEFFMVRVAGLWGQVQAGVEQISQDGRTPNQQFKDVWTEAKILIDKQQQTWKKLVSELRSVGIKVLTLEELTQQDSLWLEKTFLEQYFPVLTPLAIDPAHPFPFLPNRGFGVVMKLRRKSKGTTLTAILPIPRQLNRFVCLPGGKGRFIRVEQLVLLFLSQLFPGYELLGHGCYTIIRDSDIEVEEEAEDLARLFESALRRRRRGTVISLTVDNIMPPDLVNFLINELNIEKESVIVTDGIVALEDTKQLIVSQQHDLLFDPFHARFPERIREFGSDCFAAIKEKDIIVHHPYESFDVVVQFLRQAADDPNVVAIKQTLYRTSDDSPIVRALIQAAENGKSVTALVELKARFDEEANIRWSRDMERAGVHVVFGFMQLKTHAKISLVIRRTQSGLQSYVHFGTGNYHPITAKTYTDLSFFTVDRALCKDAGKVFNYLTGYAKPDNFEKLSISPITMRAKIIDLIEFEKTNVSDGKKGGIWAKLNSLVDPEIIDRLYSASQAGVKIDLIIRGICCLRPQIKGLSDNITVRSIVGRFLEHSRILCFGSGYDLPSNKSKVFLTSADIMPRNLDRRVEALVPIENPTVHEQIMNQIMVANLKDNVQAWELNSDGSYSKIYEQGNERFSAHNYFMENPSLSGRGKSLKVEHLRQLVLENTKV